MSTTTRTNRSSEPVSTGARVWIAIGLILMLAGVGIVLAAFWYVEQRRASLKPTSSLMTHSDSSTLVAVNPTTLRLKELNREELLRLVPAYALNGIKSEMGEGQPDDLRVIDHGDDQYLVLLSSQLGKEEAIQRQLSVFKLDGNHFADITKQVLPSEFSEGRMGDELVKVNFIDHSYDLEITSPIGRYGTDLIEECFGCEHAYFIQELNWCGSEYQMGMKQWRNDPYTAFYLVAQALANKSLAEDQSTIIDPALAADITQGFERAPGQRWSVQNLTSQNPRELQTLDTISYFLTNGTNGIKITVTKQEGNWRVSAIDRSDSEKATSNEP
ncbi:MAG: hypothetical protein AB1489_05155 [Acidobacteriota bacterium]